MAKWVCTSNQEKMRTYNSLAITHYLLEAAVWTESDAITNFC